MYTEIKYLNLLSVRLEKFKKKGDYLWNFRCPICGDSQRNKNKARGFVFQVKGKLRYKCHNCGASHTIDKFIEFIDPVLYKQFKLEKFQDSGKKKVNHRKIEKAVSKFSERMNDFQFEVLTQKSVLDDLTSLTDLNNSHPAREYIDSRQLPHQALYWTEKFQEWTNTVKPGTFQDIKKDEGRIIIPFIDKEGIVFGYQGRSLSPDGLRYITILLEEDRPKIFGLNRINYDSPIQICEGPFDSLLLENAVAMAGADLSGSDVLGTNVVYILDNEPRNTSISARLQKLIDDDNQVVIWPSNIKQKDINDMYLAGISVSDVIKLNTYSGLTAQLKYNEWKK
jgi:hypothetical protein